MKKIFRKDEIGQIAKEILAIVGAKKSAESATVVALSGDLGAGKTTLTQAIARELGITETVISPTFVIMKRYELPDRPRAKENGQRARGFGRLIHIDAYRLNSAQELAKLGWAELIADPKNLILIEWPERVSAVVPENAYRVSLIHKNEEERQISCR